MQEDLFRKNEGNTSSKIREREREGQQRERIRVQYRPLVSGTVECPNCHQKDTMEFKEGCLTCSNCGYAKCGN